MPPVAAPLGVLPGEFEHQQAVVLACDPMVAALPALFAELVERLSGRVPIVALVGGPRARRAAIKALEDRHVATVGVHFVNLKHNSMWARDFGPQAVRSAEGHWSLVDTIYTCPNRSADDAAPQTIGKALHMPVAASQLQIDGGNLITNGRGLLVATQTLAQHNLVPGMTGETLRKQLGEFFGARDVLLLEPLVGEPTGHVDMFATFTAPDTIVVGQLDPREDLENATILDRNAARLASLRSGGKRLRVERVPMPTHGDGIWRTYTNVLYANGLLLVPAGGDIDKPRGEIALATYRRLLPAWRVEAIDTEPLLALGGALHCVALNLCHIERLPQWEQAVADPFRSIGPRRMAPQFEQTPSGH